MSGVPRNQPVCYEINYLNKWLRLQHFCRKCTYDVLCHSKGVNRYPFSAFVRPIYQIKSLWSPESICSTLVEGYRGASARENKGLETAGSGSRNGKRNLWKAEPSKVFLLPLNGPQEGKFLIYFFITSKVIDGMSWKIYEFVGVMQAVSVENCPKRVRSNIV